MSVYQSSVTQDSSSHSVLPNIFEKQMSQHHIMYKYIRSYHHKLSCMSIRFS